MGSVIIRDVGCVPGYAKLKIKEDKIEEAKKQKTHRSEDDE